MRLRQAKKIMGWCKGEGNSRSKDHRKSFWRKCNKLRPGYYDERGVWVQPSCHDIDIIRRANTRMRRWFKKRKLPKYWANVDNLINAFEEKYNEATN